MPIPFFAIGLQINSKSVRRKQWTSTYATKMYSTIQLYSNVCFYWWISLLKFALSSIADRLNWFYLTSLVLDLCTLYVFIYRFFSHLASCSIRLSFFRAIFFPFIGKNQIISNRFITISHIERFNSTAAILMEFCTTWICTGKLSQCQSSNDSSWNMGETDVVLN